MEKKTIEEMRVAVLAECETVCKESMQCYGIGNGLKISKSSSQYVIEYQDDRGNWWILATINKYTESSDSLILVFYRLLGLSERDAVAAERAEMMKTVDALSAMVTVDPVAFAQLEAKNAALVAALGKIRNACRIAVTTRDFQEKGTMYKIETCIDSALAANEKGGSND